MSNRVYLSLLAATFLLTVSSLCLAQQQPPAKSEAREVWRKAMVKTPLPKNGCFTASYPNKGWKEVPCSTAPLDPPEPQTRKGSGARGGFTTDSSASPRIGRPRPDADNRGSSFDLG